MELVSYNRDSRELIYTLAVLLTLLLSQALSPSVSLSTRWGHTEKDSCLQARKRALSRNWIGHTLILNLSASRNVRNKFLLFKLPSLKYFVMAAQAHEDDNKYFI